MIISKIIDKKTPSSLNNSGPEAKTKPKVSLNLRMAALEEKSQKNFEALQYLLHHSKQFQNEISKKKT